MAKQQFTQYGTVAYAVDYFCKKSSTGFYASTSKFAFNFRRKYLFYFLLLACLFDQQIMRSGFNCVFLDTPLIIASLLDDSAELLKVLVQYGAYLDFRSEAGYTALHNVAMIGRIETLEVGFICFEKRFLCCYRKS